METRKKGSTERVKSDLLRRTRHAHGLSQQAMAAALGCSVDTIKTCERLGLMPARGGLPERVRAMAAEVGVKE